ncbi:hypothetical protein HGRIS_003462 [Hohenbuehelia grisea]|uniref:SHSP domain-containing protein n=1 Tax=Hohenbuehelia grisea TaxID=104357 RepID=A0ABR3JFJ7_9AGAR
MVHAQYSDKVLVSKACSEWSDLSNFLHSCCHSLVLALLPSFLFHILFLSHTPFSVIIYHYFRAWGMYPSRLQSSTSRNQLRRTSEQPHNPSPITPTVTRLAFPSPIDTAPQPSGRHNPMLNETESHVSAYDDLYSTTDTPSYDTVEPVTPTDYESLDQLWDTLRQQKEAKMAKEPPKVKSFEGIGGGRESAPREPISEPLRSERRSEPKHSSNKKPLSSITFRECSDGRSVMAYFNLPGLTKQDVHVSFQRSRLVISWDEVQVTEQEDRSMVIQERREKTFNKIIPLPDGTKFEDIRAAMDGDRLVLRYPNIDSRPAENRARNRSRHS